MSRGTFSPLLHYDNKPFSMLGQWGRGRSKGRGGQFVGRRHLLVTGKDTVHHHPAVFGYLFLRAFMVRNSEQIIGVARSFFCLQEQEKVVILWVNTEGNHGSSK